MPSNIMWRHIVLGFELEQMSEYLDFVDNTLQQNIAGIVERYEEQMAKVGQGMDELEIAMLEDSYAEEFTNIGHEFPQFLYLSFMIMWYSFVEKKLLNFCDNLKLSITVGSQDKGIDRAKKLLREAKGYRIGETEYWQELKQIQRIRNLVVHQGERLPTYYSNPDGNW